jgi:L,D-transpeptidase-like protein
LDAEGVGCDQTDPIMEARARRAAALAAAFLISITPLGADTVPFWGAKDSEPIGTDPKNLKPGQFIWDADAAPKGPLVVVVSLPEQRARVYRNGVSIGVSTVSTGRPGHVTPTGVFTILNKDKDHRSKTYDNAPMPYSERLTWDGVALHAGGLPGYPESHGCVHLPTRFAQLLFSATDVGMTVVIANDKVAPVDVTHPAFLAPVSATGTEDEQARLSADETMRWEPEKSSAGPVTVVVSAADRRIIVFRNGIEIGRARITITDPQTPIGNSAFVLQTRSDTQPAPDSPAGMRWSGIALPGATVGGGVGISPKAAARVTVPPAFVTDVFAILTPGATLYLTDSPVLPETTGPTLNVLNSDPPPAAR